MTVEQVEEQTESKELNETEIEKEGAAKEYSQEYLEEILAAAKEYLPKSVWDHIHSRARPKAGGRVSGKARQAARAAASSQNAENAPSAEAVQQPPEVEAQLQEARSQGLHKSEESSWTSNAYPQSEVPVEMEKTEMETTETIEKSISDSDKSKLAAEVKSKSTADLSAYLRRIHMQAAQGHLLAGFSQADMNWFAGQIGDELKRKAEASGGESSAGAPLKWGAVKAATEKELKEYEQVGKCSFNAVDDIRERESEKEKSASASEKKAETKKAEPEIIETKEVEKAEPIEPSEPIEPFVGSQPLVAAQQPLITFVAASPGVIESLRKEALVGPAGRIFDEHYLKPLELTRDQIAITYLVPRLLKDEAGKVREPTESEINTYLADLQNEFDIARRDASGASGATSGPLVVALGHTVKKALGSTVDVTLPHPNALGTVRTNEELLRKREQLKKMVEAKINYTKYGRVVGKK